MITFLICLYIVIGLGHAVHDYRVSCEMDANSLEQSIERSGVLSAICVFILYLLGFAFLWPLYWIPQKE